MNCFLEAGVASCALAVAPSASYNTPRSILTGMEDQRMGSFRNEKVPLSYAVSQFTIRSGVRCRPILAQSSTLPRRVFQPQSLIKPYYRQKS
jgi:hypothetical protein